MQHDDVLLVSLNTVNCLESLRCLLLRRKPAKQQEGLPGTTPPDALKKFTGPDDGNPQGIMLAGLRFGEYIALSLGFRDV